MTATRRRPVLVTGAGGIVGGELCRVLLARGHSVVAVLRRGRVVRGADGAELPMRPWAEGPGPHPALGAARCAGRARLARVDAVPGDLTQACPELEALFGGAPPDAVVHAAAVTGFSAPEALARAVNVGATARVLALAAQRGVAVLHVSTAYVCGWRDGPVAEAAAAPGARFANAYEATKAEAEALALAAGAAVARPSVVVGRHADGAIGRFDGVYALLRLAGEGRVRSLPAAAGAALDLVPLCHVAGALADLAERVEAARGRIFHLASGAPVPVAALCGLVRAFPGFAAPSLVEPGAFDAALLPPAERWWHGQVAHLFAPYLRGPGPLFEARALAALSGRECPAVDAAFLRRCVRFAVAGGFLRPYRMSG